MPKYRVAVTEPAAQDLQNIADYIAVELQEPNIAKKQLAQIRESVVSLAEYPDRHALLSDDTLAFKGYRMFMVNSYMVFYIVDNFDRSVTIIRVLHCRRDWNNILINE